MGLIDRIRGYFSRPTTGQGLKTGDDEFYVGVSPNSFRDRTEGNFQVTLENSLQAWRENALARRIVNLYTQYVVGPGCGVECDNPEAAAFLDKFWNHPLNHMDVRLDELCDELTRTGNLFILISSDIAGMTYIRAVPATAIKNIETAKNDYEQPQFFEYQEDNQIEIKKVYAEDRLFPTLETRMYHFAVNRPVGGKYGEPDLAPVLIWLQRYSQWLEDRVRLNHYRNSFLFTVKTMLKDEDARKRRQNELNMKPPTPGSILVTNESETWDVISAKLESGDAANDGLAIKKQIAAGTGIPLHFLAEPESQNKASAEAAGGATYKSFEQRQKVFLYLCEELMRIALRRRRLIDRSIPDPDDIHLELIGADIYPSDNNNLATAGATTSNIGTQLRKLGYISRKEFVRKVYKASGEEDIDVDMILKEGIDDPLTEEEKIIFYRLADGEDDPTKYNTTTIDGSVAHYDQGSEVN